MKHLGDITKINGAEVPVVDCIIGGSPCQDLSIAGARKGFEGDRSVLFMDQVRVTKEMREHDRASGRPDELLRPRYMVWENVVGALSSGKPKGADFAAVLNEIVRTSVMQRWLPCLTGSGAFPSYGNRSTGRGAVYGHPRSRNSQLL